MEQRPQDSAEEVERLRREIARLREVLDEKDAFIVNLNFRVLELQRGVAWKAGGRIAWLLRRLLLADRLNLFWILRRSVEVSIDEGWRGVWQRTAHKVGLALRGRDPRVRVTPNDFQLDLTAKYQVWLQRYRHTDGERMEHLIREFRYTPLVSIVTPVYNTDETLLARTIESVRKQGYPRWELCLVNDGSTKPHVAAALERYAAMDERIRVKHLAANCGIVSASREALALASGEFVGLLDHDDELTPEALYEVVRLLNSDPDLDLIYTDEDKLDPTGQRIEPFFKPDWNPDLLLSMNYITHFSVIRRSVLLESGGIRDGFDGSQDYDLLLRVTEKTDKIGHIPKILYHWRQLRGSAAASATAKPYAYVAAQRALTDALQRRGYDGEVEQRDFGVYRVHYRVRGAPLVSIIVPTRDQAALLRQCVRSIEENTRYRGYEIVVLDNDTRDPGALSYLETLGRRWTVHACPGPFNFAAINNVGASKASGDYLLFLNNDVQIADPGWLEAMLEQAQRPEVGAVGAKLLYPDGRIQHAGLVLGVSGPVSHAFQGLPGDAPSYWGFADVVRDCSAVTGACLMVRRAVFEDAGGFDERFEVAYNDVDLCLRLRRRGYLVVYTPFARLYHHESATRGQSRPLEEEALCWEIWGDVIKRGDPYYNPNLTRTRPDWSLDLG